MPLNPNVLVSESDVAACVGTVLNGTSYVVMGLTLPQSNFQSIINRVASDEANLLGSAVYTSSDPLIGPAVVAFQIADSAYRIVLSLPGYSATYFASGVGDTHFDPSILVTLMESQAKRFLLERDRAFRSLQNILLSDTGTTMIDSNQPGYSQASSPIY